MRLNPVADLSNKSMASWTDLPRCTDEILESYPPPAHY